MSRPEQPISRAANLAYAAVAAQSGCLTLIIIVGALLGGIWLDAQFGTRGPFVLGALLFSVPFSLFLMVRIALGAIDQIKPPVQRPTDRLTEEDER